MQESKTKYLTVIQTAKLLNCHKATVRRMLSDGRLRGFQLGKYSRWRVDQDSIKFLIKKYGNVSDEVTEMYQCTDCMYRMVEAEVDAEEAMKAIGLV